jgi:hypothetical protein
MPKAVAPSTKRWRQKFEALLRGEGDGALRRPGRDRASSHGPAATCVRGADVDRQRFDQKVRFVELTVNNGSWPISTPSIVIPSSTFRWYDCYQAGCANLRDQAWFVLVGPPEPRRTAWRAAKLKAKCRDRCFAWPIPPEEAPQTPPQLGRNSRMVRQRHIIGHRQRWHQRLQRSAKRRCSCQATSVSIPEGSGELGTHGQYRNPQSREDSGACVPKHRDAA